MADPIAIKDLIVAKLKAVPHVSGGVFDGGITGKIPVDSRGFTLPYIVLYAGPGQHPGETLLDGTIGTDGRVIDFTTICVGPATTHATGVAIEVQKALTNLRAGTGRIRPNPDGFGVDVPYPADGNPTRYMLPLQWRLNTN